MGLGFRGRTQTFTIAAAVTAGMLLGGLGFPFVFGHVETTSVGTATPLTLSSPGLPGGPQGPGTTTPTTPSGAPVSAPNRTTTDAGGSVSGPTFPGAPGGSVHIPPGTLGPSDRGVTATSIRVGVTILDLGGVGKVGVSLPGYSPAHQEQVWSGYFNELNKRGGINGRKVTPVYQEYDITSTDSMQAACLSLTQDHKVFAVLDTSGFMGAPVLCLTQQHATPFVTVGELGTPTEFYSEANGYLFTLHADGNRQMRNMASVIAAAGALKGKTIGILAEQGLGFDTTFNTLEAQLKALGHPSTYRYTLASDPGTAASQLPVAVNQMVAHHVDAIFLVANLIFDEQFVNQAQGENYTPAYFTSDWGTGENISGTPSSFDGALAVTETNAFDWNEGLPQPAYDAQCQHRGTADSGYVWDPSSSASINHPADMRDCSLVDLFTWAARAAGPNLTRTGLLAAMKTLGTVPIATFPPSGSFGPTKYDAADYVRIDRYQSQKSCGAASRSGCFFPLTAFAKAQY
ncbi:MAG: ABC transporter substrate-binding protein [Acidimicrobiales bacterium]